MGNKRSEGGLQYNRMDAEINIVHYSNNYMI
jgi:hypothetical protein